MKTTAHVDEIFHDHFIEIDLNGKLSREDYEMFVPTTEKLIRQHGKIRMMVKLEDFDGWNAGALWEDLKWDAKHFNDIDRLAIVGEERWHQWMTGFCKPFTTAKVRYYTFEQLEEAYAWVKEPKS